MPIVKSANILEQIGNTPLVRLEMLEEAGSAAIYAKVEAFNPGGSIKDRICLCHDRGGGTGRLPEAGSGGGGADQRQHRDRPLHGLRRQGVQAGADHARYHEHRTEKAPGRLRRRTGPHPGSTGDAGSGAEGRRTLCRPWLPAPPAVQEPGQSRSPQEDDRARRSSMPWRASPSTPLWQGWGPAGP